MNPMTTIRERAGVWRAPGRANLMGEHTDCNQGLVLPFAIAQRVTAAAALRDDGMLVLRSRQAPAESAAIALDALAPGTVTGWAAYPAGVAWALRVAGYQVPGATIDIDSDLPVGAGLSSSAGLECATALALTGLAGRCFPRRELVEIARRAENDFIGVPSGIMDQSASLLCEAGHALLLDCRTLEISQVPFDPAAAGTGLLVINTRAEHAHADGDYARRRAECEEAARQLGCRSSAAWRTPTTPAASPTRSCAAGPGTSSRQCPGPGGRGPAPLRVRRPGRLRQDRRLALRGPPVAARRLRGLLAAR
jgi:galactokinase